MTAAELGALIDDDIDEIQANIDAYDERAAIAREHIDQSSATTAQRAIAVLQRPERYRGEHAVARAWLQNYAPNTGIFRRGCA